MFGKNILPASYQSACIGLSGCLTVKDQEMGFSHSMI